MIGNALTINEQGHLCIGGADTVDLAARYGTPLMVYDEQTVRDACRRYMSSVRTYYKGNGLILYASKAFSCKEIYRLVAQEGLGADVVSGGELYTALQAGFPPERIYFHGNNKTRAELEEGLRAGVGFFVVDNLTELTSLAALASAERPAQILLRVKPGVDAHTHSFVRTGQIDSKFGFALETGEALEAAKQSVQIESIKLCGVQCHIGSQIFELEPFCLAAERMIEFMTEIRRETGCVLEQFNLGGGFGIQYVETDRPLPYEAFLEAVSQRIFAACSRHAFPVPRVILEPGRSIVGPAGITLYTVGAVKTIPGVRTYVSVDGGMTDNPRYALYGSQYEILAANKASAARERVVTVAGRCCESGDLIQENVRLQNVAPGDLLAVCATGAYNYSMASNYNRVPRPAVVMVRGGEARVIIRRESYADLIRNDQ